MMAEGDDRGGTAVARAGAAAEGRDRGRRACSTASRRGRYATDASHYQIMPLGVVAPRTMEEAERAIAICARGGRAGAAARRRHVAGRPDRQPLARHRLLEASQRASSSSTSPAAAARSSPASCSTTSTAQLKPHGLWFPVDVSTASRATIGGMTANNSCGGRSLRYGNTRENVLSIDARAGRRQQGAFRPGRGRPLRPAGGLAAAAAGARPARARRARGRRDRGALSRRCSAGSAATTSTRCVPGRNDVNLAHILVGSEGTLGVLHRDRAEALAAARPARGRRLPFRQLPRGDGRRRSTSSSSARSRSSWSTAP